MYKFTDLPNWCLTGSNPAFYDTDSATAVEQTAKLYGAMKTLIKESENAINQLDKEIEDFKNGINQDQEEFKTNITKIMHDYIHSIDTKIDSQDLAIVKAIEFMTTNLSSSINELITDMKESGEIDEAIVNGFDNLGDRVNTLENTEYALVYEVGTENLILQKTVKDGV